MNCSGLCNSAFLFASCDATGFPVRHGRPPLSSCREQAERDAAPLPCHPCHIAVTQHQRDSASSPARPVSSKTCIAFGAVLIFSLSVAPREQMCKGILRQIKQHVLRKGLWVCFSACILGSATAARQRHVLLPLPSVIHCPHNVMQG